MSQFLHQWFLHNHKHNNWIPLRPFVAFVSLSGVNGLYCFTKKFFSMYDIGSWQELISWWLPRQRQTEKNESLITLRVLFSVSHFNSYILLAILCGVHYWPLIKLALMILWFSLTSPTSHQSEWLLDILPKFKIDFLYLLSFKLCRFKENTMKVT